MYQSPYKGFNRILFYNEQYIKTDESINPLYGVQ